MAPRLVQPALERDDDAITVNEAARLLGCHHSTVRELVRIRELLGHNVGKTKDPGGVRIRRGSVLDYLERHTIGAPAAEPAPKPGRRQPAPRMNPALNETLAALRAIGVRV